MKEMMEKNKTINAKMTATPKKRQGLNGIGLIILGDLLPGVMTSIWSGGRIWEIIVDLHPKKEQQKQGCPGK